MKTVGFIGLGQMGKPIAQNILKAGFSLVVYNRSQGAVDELVNLGAQAASSVVQLTAQVEVVFTCLPDLEAVEQVVLGENGIITGAHPGLVFVDHSTIKPAASRRMGARLAEQGVESLDAPIIGNAHEAQQAGLTFFVGGGAAVLESVRPILQASAQAIVHIGEIGAGQVARAACQMMVSSQLVALSEALLLSQKAGVDPQQVVSALKNSPAQCWALDTQAQRLLSGERQADYRAQLQAKDMNIVVETAREYGVQTPSAILHYILYNTSLDLGMGDLDRNTIIGVIEKMSNEKLKN